MELIRNGADRDAIDAMSTMYPCRLEVIAARRTLTDGPWTGYGYVVSGTARIVAAGLTVQGDAGTFFCLPAPIEIEPQSQGRVALVQRFGFRGVPSVGRIEATGRLAYIDGCSDTMLVAPPRLGDPVLNHLHFPAGIEQTRHIHPSIRLGVVARGSGVAFGPGWEEPLETGHAFLIHAHEPHSFRTGAGASMDVIAFHPDSDWGPTDGVHPMKNRTYLSGPGHG